MSINDNRFSGISSLLGSENLVALSKAHFLVIGLGGVGTWAVESLARSGVGKLTLVDLDDICVSNTNRQLHAHEGNYGKMKVEAMAERIRLINPKCQVAVDLSYFNKKSINRIFETSFDMVLDAIDGLPEKCLLANHCYQNNIKLVVAGSAGGKLDPTQVKIAELADTQQDMLLRRLRKSLKRDFNYPLGEGKVNVKCVYSMERTPHPEVCENSDNTGELRFDCAGGLGTATYMTGTFGFFLSYAAISEFLAPEK